MPRNQTANDEATELLRTMLIVQLGLAGIGQRRIREVAGCDMNRVTKTLRALRLKRGNRSPRE
jgi:hypothetical protein